LADHEVDAARRAPISSGARPDGDFAWHSAEPEAKKSCSPTTRAAGACIESSGVNQPT